MNAAMIGTWHVHTNDYATQFSKISGCNIRAAWDSDKERGRTWAEKNGVPFVSQYQEILEDPNIDGIILCSPTNEHPSLMVEAAHHGKHIFTEKVLAITEEEGVAIQRAVKQSGVKFCISFPFKSRPELIAAKRLAESGELGELTHVRVRDAHDGSISDWLPAHFYDPVECGGGALMDLGAHPVYLLLWFLGFPKEVTAVLSNVTDRPVEDNAVCTMAFANGAIGVAETSFVSKFDSFSFEISGTKGCLLYRNGLSYTSEGTQGKPREWSGPVDAVPMPLAQWVECIKTGKDEKELDIDRALDLTRVMDAAYRSAKTRSTIKMDSIPKK